MKKILKKQRISIALVLALSCILSGCGKNSKQDSDGAPLIKMVAAAQNNTPSHLDSILATTAGFYKEEGIDMDMFYNISNTDCIQALLDGKVDVCSSSATSLLSYIDQGEDIVIIGGQMTEGASLFCLPERVNEFQEMNEETLAGKKVGVTRLQSGDIAFRSYLNSQGVDLSKIEFIEMDSCNSIIEAIKKGELDLGSIFPAFRIAAQESGLAVAKHIDELSPGFICCRIFTTRDKLEANRDAFKHVIRANLKAYEMVETDHEGSVKSALSVVDMDEKTFTDILYNYGHYTLNPDIQKNDIIDFYNSMVNIGYSEGNVNIEDHIDTELFLEALDELVKEEPENKIFAALKEQTKRTDF